jgi:hypothetical protein
LIVEAWQRCLAEYPDLAFVEYILRGTREGFRIGYNATQPIVKSKKNMRSAYEHPEVIDQQLLNISRRGICWDPLIKLIYLMFIPAELGLYLRSMRWDFIRL